MGESKSRKEKPKYSIFQNSMYIIQDNWKWRPSLLWVGVLHIPLKIIVPLLIALIPKIIIDVIEKGGGVNQLLLTVPLLVAGMILLYIAERVTQLYIDDSGMRSKFRYQVTMDVKTMELDYEFISENKGKNLREKAVKMLQDTAAPFFYSDLLMLITSVLGLVSYGSILAMLHPLILVILALSYAITWWINRYVNRYIQSRRDEEAKVFGGMRYMIKKALDLAGAKDIRLYGMQGWFQEISDQLQKKQSGIQADVAKRHIASAAISALLIFVRDGVAYALLIYKVIQGDISVSDFLVYFTMIATFADWISGILTSYNYLELESHGFCSYREYMEIEEQREEASAAIPGKEEWPCELELRGVSYTYPESEKPTISNVNLKIKAGERIALVGLNGAGKTTLVKLMCGLFRPTEGQVLINGRSASEFNKDEYFKLFSIIFQDVHLLPVSIATNITLQREEEQDQARLETCLQQSGFADKVSRLPNGKETLLVKNVNEDAYELSGGEMQKLLLARALYKEAPILILDEPTAALDPIAENELYLQYKDMTQDRTSVFISHRFASTRFCDRIILLEQGQIVEEGSHEELMQKNGRYAELFQVQSQYYQEGDEKNE
ncbi:MAG: ABC transporter ATP-binding protein [Lachnospiraceae bacterium]|jgi:ATP-binding cassette subfamily B protein|nr:ABC transporter ATP-binding protein [Lachnospiraceae bacterium]